MKRSPSRYNLHNNTKRGKILQKTISLLVHILELSTAVVKVDIKVITALTQNQCLQCVMPPLRYRDRATPVTPLS